jgi:asparagine synthase (glutamine-hydrolysing)
MCGIFGAISRGAASFPVLAGMSHLLRNRGPDGEGFALFTTDGDVLVRGGPATPPQTFGSGTSFAPTAMLGAGEERRANIAFGHRRLAIVDLSAHGHQPMASPDGRIWMVFNGEIYNHVELREELAALGHRFDSHSDTAVVIAAYRQWGVDCLSRFNGMFVLVLFDRDADKLFLARDRFGVKPLNYWTNGRTFLFASEIKAFLASPEFAVKPRREAMAHYLAVGAAEYETETMFGGVRRLSPASFIYAEPSALLDGSAQEVCWWRLDPNPSKEGFQAGKAADYAARYKELLDASVAIRLRADVKVGSALSGGLDSSSVVYLIAQGLKEQGVHDLQETFSSVYPSPDLSYCDESSFITEVGDQLRVSMNTIEPKARDVPAEHAKMIWALDTPPDSTLMSSWHTFRLVRDTGVKVTLDGQGADEQLAGYLHYLPHALAGPGVSRKANAALSLLGGFPPKYALGSVLLGTMGKNAPPQLLRNARRRALVGFLDAGLNAHLAADCVTSLSNLIHYADRTSMAFSVESRMPFLDVRLAEFLAQVPEAYKIHDGWTKYIARKAFDGLLPDRVTWRRDKMGWPIPERTWEQGELSGWFGEARRIDSAISDYGLAAEYSAIANSPSIEDRVRALNLRAWHATFVERENYDLAA